MPEDEERTEGEDLFEDLDKAWLVVLLEWSQRHALPS